jgi:hypothetical protein
LGVAVSWRIITWLVVCPRCAFRVELKATAAGIADHIDCFCPLCRETGLDAIEQQRRSFLPVTT